MQSTEPEVDKYLDLVEKRLGELPENVRCDIRRELRLHLESMISAHEELGSDRKTATSAALRQFGEPESIAKRFCRAWRSTTTVSTSVSPTRFGLAAFGIAMSLFLIAFLTTNPLGFTMYQAAIDPVRTEWLWTSMLFVPAIVGAGIGRRFPVCGWAGVFLSLSILTVLTAPLGAVAASYGNRSVPMVLTPSWYFCEVCADLTSMFLLWLPIGSLSAAVVGALTNRGAKRQTVR